MLNDGAWRKLFLITENSFEQLALEVLLATFELLLGTVSFHQLTPASGVQYFTKDESGRVLHSVVTL